MLFCFSFSDVFFPYIGFVLFLLSYSSVGLVSLAVFTSCLSCFTCCFFPTWVLQKINPSYICFYFFSSKKWDLFLFCCPSLLLGFVSYAVFPSYWDSFHKLSFSHIEFCFTCRFSFILGFVSHAFFPHAKICFTCRFSIVLVLILHAVFPSYWHLFHMPYFNYIRICDWVLSHMPFFLCFGLRFKCCVTGFCFHSVSFNRQTFLDIFDFSFDIFLHILILIKYFH